MTAEILEKTNKGYKLFTKDSKGLTKKERTGKIQYFEQWCFEYNFIKID
jgi:hypothetical protein